MPLTPPPRTASDQPSGSMRAVPPVESEWERRAPVSRDQCGRASCASRADGPAMDNGAAPLTADSDPGLCGEPARDPRRSDQRACVFELRRDHCSSGSVRPRTQRALVSPPHASTLTTGCDPRTQRPSGLCGRDALRPLQQWISETQDAADSRESPSCESAVDRVRSSPQRPSGLWLETTDSDRDIEPLTQRPAGLCAMTTNEF